MTAAPLPPALPGERFEFDGISAYVDGSGPPLMLVHSVNAAASAAEVRPVYEHARATHTVFALDLPGFGFSQRGPRAYTPRLMTDALHAMSAQIRQRCGPGPIDGLAVSLGCEFLARAAVERPAEWARLAFVSPTGVDGRRPRHGPAGTTLDMPMLRGLLSLPLWARPIYGALTRPAVVRRFLRRTWGSADIDAELLQYALCTARQPGARFAPLAFLSGALFSADITTVYDALRQPVWVSHGVRGDFTDYAGLGRFRHSANWLVTVFQTGALPHFERQAEFMLALDSMLGVVVTPRRVGTPPSAKEPSSRS